MTEAAADIATGTQRRANTRRLSTVQVVAAVILTLGLLLTLNFSSRVQLDRELQAIHSGVNAEIEALEAEQAALQKQLAYVKSDAYVEYWARDDGKMIRDGEILIVPQAAAMPAQVVKSSKPIIEIVTTAPKPENTELWWALFFDAPPPK